MIEIYKTNDDGVTKKVFAPEPGAWVSVVAPNDGQRAWLKTKSGIVAEFVAAALDDEETSHIDYDDDTCQILVIVDCPMIEDEKDLEDPTLRQYDTHPISIIFVPEKEIIVTVSLQANEILKDFAAGKVRQMNTATRTQFLLQVLMRVAQQYQKYLLSIKRQFNRTEKVLHETLRNDELIKMLGLEKSLVYFSTSLKADESMLAKINIGRTIKLTDEDRELLDDVVIETRQAIEMAQIYTNILNGTMDAFGSVINNNLSLAMRKLTIITIVLAVPTIIFSFYGMNVGLPLDASWIFPFILAVVMSIAVVLVFTKSNLFK
ncbi:MAG: magnesium transporter CorA family protein [Coriobacteriales bacterium]|nr:magnesium transporter CorA family protein [Coriobacteriales bacterium]